jgi:hypothetical protein
MKPKYEIFKNSYCEYSFGGRDQWIITPLANYDHIMYATGKSKIPSPWRDERINPKWTV